MPPDPAAERVECLLEPFALVGDELLQAVPFGYELADSLLELLGVLTCGLRLARELRCQVRERLPVLLELRSGGRELDLELRDDVGLAAPAR